MGTPCSRESLLSLNASLQIRMKLNTQDENSDLQYMIRSQGQKDSKVTWPPFRSFVIWRVLFYFAIFIFLIYNNKTPSQNRLGPRQTWQGPRIHWEVNLLFIHGPVSGILIQQYICTETHLYSGHDVSASFPTLFMWLEVWSSGWHYGNGTDLDKVGIPGRSLAHCSTPSEELWAPLTASFSRPWFERSLHGHTHLLLLHHV